MPELEGDRKQGNYLGEEGLSFLWGPTSHYGPLRELSKQGPLVRLWALLTYLLRAGRHSAMLTRDLGNPQDPPWEK